MDVLRPKPQSIRQLVRNVDLWLAGKSTRISKEEKAVELIRCAAVATFAMCLVGCGTSTPSPGEVTQNYLSTIAEGDYASSCAELGARARQSLVKRTDSHATCSETFALCLPNEAAKLKHDQTQLFYVNELVSITGSSSDVHVSGTKVANEVREVTLVKKRGVWRLTSPGKKLESCRLKGGTRKGRHG